HRPWPAGAAAGHLPVGQARLYRRQPGRVRLVRQVHRGDVRPAQPGCAGQPARHLGPHGLLQLLAASQSQADPGQTAVLKRAVRAQRRRSCHRRRASSTVTPASGGPGTVFTYDVLYQNSVAPTVHNLVIDGTTTIPMSVKKTVGKMQEWEATSTLAPGPHTYTFQFGNGTNSWQLPLNSTPFSGPQVMPFKLTGIKVTPSNGAQQLGKPVVFNCIYTSPAGKTPVTAQINIDNNVHPMNAISGTPTKGIRYQYTTPSLSQGTHYFQLQFDDGSGLRTQQEYSVDVTPIYLQNSKVTPTSGTASPNFTFSTVYTGPGPATVVEVVVNG